MGFGFLREEKLGLVPTGETFRETYKLISLTVFNLEANYCIFFFFLSDSSVTALAVLCHAW